MKVGIASSISQSGLSQNIAATAVYPASSINPNSQRTGRTPAAARIQFVDLANTAGL